MVSKVRGSTFHLPLPLQETLKRLPTPSQPIPGQGELYILLRSIPTAKNVVWQDLVDINKVHSALCKLREINPFYSEIQLPADASELELNLSITEHISEQTNTDDDDDCVVDYDDEEKDPMVRKVEKDEEAELYKNYTVQLLHAPRENQKATDLYQMLRINEPAIDGCCKQLDHMCFPNLFPFGVGGMHYSREVSLTASDYVKTIIQSRDSRFRLNQQFLFYQATRRQLSSGIYHKLKIMRPQERITAGRYLEMIQKEEIEGDLTSVFHRLQNSEQF